LDVLVSIEVAMPITTMLIAGLVTCAIHAQTPIPKPALSKIRSIEKESGWQIPGLAQSRILDRRKLVPKGYGVSGVPLHITVFKPRREVRATISLFGLKQDGQTLVMGQRTGAVQSIIKCDIDNRVFVYLVSFYALVADQPGDPVVSPELRIPDWARQTSRAIGTSNKALELTAR
jgi:hypothetical protein